MKTRRIAAATLILTVTVAAWFPVAAGGGGRREIPIEIMLYDTTPIMNVDASDPLAFGCGTRSDLGNPTIRNPDAPGAMEAVLELGLDSRYYVMVRGWLAMQLRGDISILQVRKDDVSPPIAARIAFLEKAIPALDLE